VSYSKCSIIGYSGHGLVVAEAAKLSGLPLSFYTDLSAKSENPYQLKYIGDESIESFQYWDSNYAYVLGIGDNAVRVKCAQNVLSKGRELVNVIHPDACISAEVTFGQGNFFSRNCAINPMVKIGDFCILNTSCVVEHHCLLGDGVHVAPGAVLLGNVHVGAGSFIGANSVVKQGVKIGENVIIGAGAVVLKDVGHGKTIVGNPGRIL
jgi:sugar O-acyltransferase (sialic acid O-acetyltransferase NeuD family)